MKKRKRVVIGTVAPEINIHTVQIIYASQILPPTIND
jgi:hypothetical protein